MHSSDEFFLEWLKHCFIYILFCINRLKIMISNLSLYDIEIYKYNKEWIARTWGIPIRRFPYVEESIAHAGNWIIGGGLEFLEQITCNDGLDHYKISPKQLCEEFEKCKADAVFSFQLRNPIHNGHALIMKYTHRLLEMRYKNLILLLHPLGGFTKSDDVPLSWRMRQHGKVTTT
jgi:3'-phosphoadenosine 5'-phosphosulfate synthase